MSPTETWNPQNLDTHLRSIYLSRETGVLEVEVAGAQRRLIFCDGDLYLPAAHPLAEKVRELLADTSTFTEVEVLAFTFRLAAAMAGWRAGKARFRPGELPPADELVGPLPTFHLVMELAVSGRSSAELLSGLGGEGARLRTSDVDRRLARPPLLDAAELELLERLQKPASVATLAEEAGATDPGQRLPLLCRLARLRALGWLSRERDEGARRSSRALAERFALRVGKLLEDRPVRLDPDSHRALLADLLAGLGARTHYEILSVAPGSGFEQIHDAYEELARLVHPRHAVALGLEGREVALELLFERATEAYFTLSDARRRADYDRELGIQPTVVPVAEERDAEKKAMGERYYQKARKLFREEDVHGAVELLKDAARYDPRPEIFALMGEAQARNPLWHRQALHSLDKAMRLGSADARVWLVRGQVLEQMERPEDAKVAYRKALAANRADLAPEAETGLARLSHAPRSADAERKGGFWRRLLGLGDGGDGV